jgi:hypothetical protein
VSLLVVGFVVVGAGGTPAVLKADIASWGVGELCWQKEPAETPAVLKADNARGAMGIGLEKSAE